jgi:hypothetical protein
MRKRRHHQLQTGDVVLINKLGRTELDALADAIKLLKMADQRTQHSAPIDRLECLIGIYQSFLSNPDLDEFTSFRRSLYGGIARMRKDLNEIDDTCEIPL